jgi:predicted RNase H-like HicB family nuclease
VKRYAILIYKAGNNYSAHVPDVDGCIASGSTIEDTAANLRDALEFHFEAMAEHGETIPEPEAIVEYIEVEVPTKTKPAANPSRARKKVPARR